MILGHKGQNLNGRIGRSIEEYVEQVSQQTLKNWVEIIVEI